MKKSMRWFLDRSYLAGYAVLLAVTITLAMAIGGTAALASDGVAVPGKSIRGVMLAQATGARTTRTRGRRNKKPNIVIIWGDDIGQSNISAYSKGMMGYRTPNIDSIADQGMIFTDGCMSCL